MADDTLKSYLKYDNSKSYLKYDNSNRLILSKISMSEAYVFAGQVQDSLNELSHACERYYGLLPPFLSKEITLT